MSTFLSAEVREDVDTRVPTDLVPAVQVVPGTSSADPATQNRLPWEYFVLEKQSHSEWRESKGQSARETQGGLTCWSS